MINALPLIYFWLNLRISYWSTNYVRSNSRLASGQKYTTGKVKILCGYIL